MNSERPTETLETFRDSLAIGGIDGTLRRRFRTHDVALHSHMHGKTGTLRKVIALSGFLAREDGRTICFSIVTNGHPNHRKRSVRLEHEHLVAKLDTFLNNDNQAIALAVPAHNRSDTLATASVQSSVPLSLHSMPVAASNIASAAAKPSCSQAKPQAAKTLVLTQRVPTNQTLRLPPLR